MDEGSQKSRLVFVALFLVKAPGSLRTLPAENTRRYNTLDTPTPACDN